MKHNPLFQLIKQFQGKISPNIYSPLNSKTDPKHQAFLRHLEKELDTEKSLTIPLNELNVVVFDLETTGFFPERGDQILSIGAVKINKGQLNSNEMFYSLVHYAGTLSPPIKQLTLLDESELQAASPLSEVLVRFYRFVQKDILVAHHASHEKKFLQHAHWKWYKNTNKHRIVDTSLVFKLVEPDPHVVSLEHYCTHANIQVRNRHHALGDAIMTAELWQYYVAKLQDQGVHTLKDVYERLARR